MAALDVAFPLKMRVVAGGPLALIALDTSTGGC
jgi:hypothetical protein